ncbi:MAG: hypothetical protein AB7P03_21580 [Kofleriaceae bacterium]
MTAAIHPDFRYFPRIAGVTDMDEEPNLPRSPTCHAVAHAVARALGKEEVGLDLLAKLF